MNKVKLIMCAGAACVGLGWAGAAAAQAAAPAPAAPAASPMPYPSVTAPMAANPNPAVFDAGPLGKLTVDGVLSADVIGQSSAIPGNRDSYIDITNAQVIVNKTDGFLQFYVQAGAYSIPALGAAIATTSQLDSATFGYVPQGFVKLVPNANFNVMVGALPTLIGAEYTFSFQNMNIERGLLWGQEPAISKGVQANFTSGPLVVSGAFTDGYYSDVYTALSGLISYTFKNSDNLTFAAEGSISNNHSVVFAAPPMQNNGQIYNLIFTHTQGPWTITPYLQYNNAHRIVPVGNFPGSLAGDAWGGAILTKYNFTPEFSLAGRVEYITSDGKADLLGYGPGSNAWSITLTPTYQKGIFFVRGEVSYVGIGNANPGEEFGSNRTSNNQIRGLIETGVSF